jgi:SAM-dependent methyltransferase
MRSAKDLLDESEARPVKGWDFSWLGTRLTTHPLEWSFESIVVGYAQRSADLLDMSTGGGEWLSALPHRPVRTVATEGWALNVAVAHARLRPLGVRVVWSEDAPDNVEQLPGERRGRLPFRTGSFTLVINRHASFLASEVARVLSPGGTFVTEQVGADYSDVYDALDQPLPKRVGEAWSVALASRQLRDAGLDVIEAREAVLTTDFADVGAFAWYLKAVPWALPGFSIGRYRSALVRLHDRVGGGPMSIRVPSFVVHATK